jgi:ribosomal protein L32
MTKEEVLTKIEAEENWLLSTEYTAYNIDIAFSSIMNAVKDITLEQEPETGHWILLDECANSGYYCSKCHKKVVKEGWSNTVKKIKYCPNCGSLMMEEG